LEKTGSVLGFLVGSWCQARFWWALGARPNFRGVGSWCQARFWWALGARPNFRGGFWILVPGRICPSMDGKEEKSKEK